MEAPEEGGNWGPVGAVLDDTIWSSIAYMLISMLIYAHHGINLPYI